MSHLLVGMNRAWNCLVALGTAVALQACGDPSASDLVGPDKQAVQCDDLPSYMCDDYPEQCRLDEVRYLDPTPQCYRGEMSLNCSERADCVEEEWFAEADYGTFLVRGCINDPLPRSSIITEPSEELVAAATISCVEKQRMIDETCRGFTANECPVNQGCRVDTQQVLDPERGCATGETHSVCLGVTTSIPGIS